MKLAAFLKEQGRSQKWLAEQVPCREATVAAWMGGTIPRAPHMKRVAEITGGVVPPAAWFEPEKQSGEAAA